MEYSFGMGALPYGSIKEVQSRAAEEISENPVTEPGTVYTGKTLPGNTDVPSGTPSGGILGGKVIRVDSRMGYRYTNK